MMSTNYGSSTSEIPSELPEPTKPLTPVIAWAIVGVLATVILAAVGVNIYQRSFPERYVIDFYPANPEVKNSRAVAVIRWPSKQAQLPPVELPLAISTSDKWSGSRPKRASLRPDTILPAGEVLRYDESVPPGRYVIQLGREIIEVNPEAKWSRGTPPSN